MEFGEKLQVLRKNRGITQDELAKELYVSRTAVSKWESGRGYPNIESLKEISKLFSVSIDDLLTADKLVFIAEKENKENIGRMCDILSGTVDLLSFLLIVLPLYPDEIQGFVYSVSLMEYTQISSVNLIMHWIFCVLLILSGVIKLALTKIEAEKLKKYINIISLVLNAFMVVFLALTRESYAAVVVFLLLTAKTIIAFKASGAK